MRRHGLLEQFGPDPLAFQPLEHGERLLGRPGLVGVEPEPFEDPGELGRLRARLAPMSRVPALDRKSVV